MPSFAVEILSKNEEDNFSLCNKENNILFNNEDKNKNNETPNEEPIGINLLFTTNKDHQFKRSREILEIRKWYTWIFPLIAFILIIWVVVGYLFGFLLPIIASSLETTATRILHTLYFVIFSFFSSCIIYPFIRCTFTSPGFVFKDDKIWSLTKDQIKQYKKRGPRFIVDLEKEIKQIMNHRNEITELVSGTQSEVEQEENDQEDLLFSNSLTSELNSRGQVRICEKCWVRKPDRAHHCRQLNCCVLRMDHFCPWFNNCIGYYNHKYFFTFLVWIAITGFFIVATMSKIMFKTLQKNGSGNTFSFFTFNNLWVYILSFCFGFSMFFFAGYHFKLILFNTTTLESLDKERRLHEQYHCNPYDIGVMKNIKSVLGNNPLLWLSPFHVEYGGDGCNFAFAQTDYEPIETGTF